MAPRSGKSARAPEDSTPQGSGAESSAPQSAAQSGGSQGDGEFRSGPVAGTALISGVTFARKGVQYAEVEGLAIFEGDIVLGAVEDVRQAADAAASAPVEFSVGITGQQFRWPNATIPYDIDPAMPNQQRVTDALAHWQANTSIRFVLRTAANAAQYNDYMHFQSGSGCSSNVGRQGGKQNVTLGSGCTSGNAIHEIGHVVGLWHEQSREDRDTFVQIVWANIDPSMQHNFAQHVTDGDDLGAYDYGSIMHYPRDAFSINGQDTIVPRQALPAGVVMGQRSGLSQGDIAGVRMMYPGATTIKEVRKDPITDGTIKEVRKEPTRDTIKEIRKDPVTDGTLKEIRKDPITDTAKEIRKDPIADGTIKEAGKDPISDTLIERTGVGGGGRPGPGPFNQEAAPFVVSGPSRAGAGGADLLAEAAARVQELADAIVQIEQQHADLLAAYDAASQDLDALSQGQG